VTDDSEQLAILISELEQQERMLQLSHFDNEDALALGDLLVELGRLRLLPIAIDIRRNGHQLFHAALPGSTPDNDSWIERKVAVVNRFSESSYLVGRRFQAKGESLDQAHGLDPIQFAAHGGSVPIQIIGVGVVGTVTVSGLAQAEDHALVIEAMTTFIRSQL
jgi:uncharacterized protein (UPF0303 family)